jgi:hypothetical protein
LANALGSHAEVSEAISGSLATAVSGLQAAESEQAETLRQLADDIEAVRHQVALTHARTGELLTALRHRDDAAVRTWQDLAASLDEDLRRVQRELGSGEVDAGR